MVVIGSNGHYYVVNSSRDPKITLLEVLDPFGAYLVIGSNDSSNAVAMSTYGNMV